VLLLFPSHDPRVQSKNIASVFDISPGEKGVGWFCVTQVIEKRTKKNKKFFRLKVADNNNNTGWIRVWGNFQSPPEEFSLWIGEIENDADWGMSSRVWRLKQIRAYDD